MRSPASKRRKLGVWLPFARLLSVVAVLMIAGPARANHAPMCDEAAASVVAPIPALPNQTGEIRATPSCPDASSTFAATPAEDRTAGDTVMQPTKRALPSGFSWPRSQGRILPIPRPESVRLPSEHRASVYRPPQG